MRHGILTILGVLLFGVSADAQFAATLQIAATNSNQVVLSVSSNALPSFYYLQSATSLTPPIQWSSVSTSWGFQAALSVTGSQQFFRVVQNVPVFELAVFYNLDLEINPGSAMTINGPVHCNGNIYATGSSSSSPLTFGGNVEASQQVTLFRSPLDPSSFRSGNVVFSNTNNNPLNNAGQLYPWLRANTNPAALLGLPPAGTDPTSNIGQAYLYNQADIIVSNSATTNTYPAALMGDAITVLSAAWIDAYNAATPLSFRNPVSTTINAATLQGIVPSDGSHYSGGVENFLRLLEDWNSGITLTYNGSIAVFFQSQYATSPWPGSGTVYGVPTRAWGFDRNFFILRLPPGTPMVVNQASP